MSASQAALLNSLYTSLICPAGVTVKISMPLTSAIPEPMPCATQRHATLEQVKKISRVMMLGMGGCAPCPMMKACFDGKVTLPSY